MWCISHMTFDYGLHGHLGPSISLSTQAFGMGPLKNFLAFSWRFDWSESQHFPLHWWHLTSVFFKEFTLIAIIYLSASHNSIGEGFVAKLIVSTYLYYTTIYIKSQIFISHQLKLK